MNIGIYKITSPSNKVYIGQSIDLVKRFNQYNFCNKTQPRIFNSIKKYGVENHLFEIIEKCEIEQLNERERYWQEFYNVLEKNGLNCKLTETHDRSGKLSDETKKKISEAHKGKKLTTETKNKLREVRKKQKPISGESRKKISEKLKLAYLEGRHREFKLASEETKQKMSLAQTGRKHSSETILKMRESQKGKIISKEQREAISKALTIERIKVVKTCVLESCNNEFEVIEKIKGQQRGRKFCSLNCVSIYMKTNNRKKENE